MKVGDLVRWVHPEALDYGLVLEMGEDRQPEGFWDNQVLIEWSGMPAHSGFYPKDHHHLELVSEGR